MNNFPISVSQIAEGMNNASSSLSAAGNSLNESIALLAAANTTVQNASKSSTALRTISARLRNSKAELEELGEEVMTTAKYQELLSTLSKENVEIVDEATGRYNSTYEIMRQLSSVWDGLDDGIKATITTQVAGIRTTDVFSSILQNFGNVAEGAMNRMTRSSGALTDAFTVYEDSVTGHLKSLNAAWQELSTALIDPEFVKDVIDSGKNIVEILTFIFDILKEIGGAQKISIGVISALILKFIGIDNAVAGFGRAFRLAEENGNSMFSSLASGAEGFLSSLNHLRLALTIITAAYTIIAKVAQKQQEARESAIKAGREAIKLSDSLADAEMRYKALYSSGDMEGVKSLQEEITKLVGEQAEGLDLVNGKYDEQLSKLRAIADEKAKDPDFINALKSEYYAATHNYEVPARAQELAVDDMTIIDLIKIYEAEWQKQLDEHSDKAAQTKLQLDKLRGSFEGMKDAAKDLAHGIKLTEVIDGISESVFESKESVDEFVSSLTNLSFNADLIDAQVKGLITLDDIDEIIRSIIATRFPEYIGLIYESTEEAAENLNNLADSIESLKDATKGLKDAYDLVTKAEKDMEAGHGISYDTLKSLMDLTESYSDYLYTENGQLKINTELLRDEADAAYKATSIRSKLKQLGSEYDEVSGRIMPKGAKQERLKEIQEEIDYWEKELEIAEAAYDAIIKSTMENPFTKMLNEHQHLMAMDQEKTEDYLAWLKTASKDAFENGWITSDELRKYEEEYYKGIPTWSDAISTLSKNYEILTKARGESALTGKLSLETIESIISATDNYTDILKLENGEIKLNEEAWKDYYTSKYDLIIRELEAEKERLELERSIVIADKEAVDGKAGAEVISAHEKQIESLGREIGIVDEKIALFVQLVEEATSTEQSDPWKEMSDDISNVTKSYSLLAEAQIEMASTGSLTFDTVNDILTTSPEYIKYLEVEGDLVRLNADAMREYVAEAARAKAVEIDSSISDLIVQRAKKRIAGDAEGVARIDAEIVDLKTMKAVYDAFSKTAAAVDNFSDSISDFEKSHNILTSAQKEIAENGKLSVSTIQSIIDATDNYTDILRVENGEIILNEEAWTEYYTSKYNAARDEVKVQNELLKLERERLVSEMVLYTAESDKLAEFTERLKVLDGEIAKSDTQLELWDAIVVSIGENIEELKDELDDYLGELKDSLSSMSETYELLATAQDEMNSTGVLTRDTVEKLLSVSEEYVQFLSVENGMIRLNTEALREYAEAQYAAKIAELNDKLKELKDNLSTMAPGSENAEELSKQIALLEQEIGVYQTLYASLTDGAAAVASTSSYIDDMRDSLTNLASVEEIVANGFLVAADNVKTLSALFPELFANAEAYADGSMRLDREVATAFLENRKAEVDASIESKIIELEAELEEVKAKKQLVDAQLELAMFAAESESKIDQQAAQYRINNADQVAQALIDAGVTEAQAYAIAAQSMFDNTFDLDTAIASATQDIAHNYGEAFASAADSSASNSLAINTNIDSTTRQAHQAASAIAGMPGGKIMGAEGVLKPGVKGSRTGKIPTTISAYTDTGTGNVQAMMNGVYEALRKSQINLSPAQFTATYFDSQIKGKSLADLILEKTGESKALELVQKQLEGQIAILKSLKKADLSSFRDKGKTGSSSAGSGGSPSTASGSGNEENPFAIAYREHQHLLAMEQESVGDYFAWLDKASREAYEKGWITLDDLRKYEEEVYKGLKEIISDAESAMKDLADFRKKMIEKEYEDQKDVLKAQLDMLKNFYDEQKEALKEQREEEEYQKEKLEKQRAVSDIEAELSMLSYDNSAKAQKRRVELQQMLVDAQEEYAEFEKDHAYELAENALESAYERQESEIQAQIDAIDTILNDPNALFNQALDDIKNDTGSLYDEMVRFAEENGEGESTVKRLWENAFIATNDLQKVTSENVQTIAEMMADLPSDMAKLITGVNMQNSTGYSTTSTTSTASNSASAGSSSTSKGGSSGDIPVGTAVKATGKAYSNVKGQGNAVDVTGRQLYVAQVWDNAANPYWQGDYTYAVAYSKDGSIVGWVRKDQLSGYAKGTRHATAGMHLLDERGSEALFVSSSGDHYRLLSDGDKVFNAEATDFLYRFANGDKDIFRNLFESLFSKSAMNSLTSRPAVGDIRMGDIIINGNTDRTTVSEIRRAQREGLDNLLQQFGRLQRAAR